MLSENVTKYQNGTGFISDRNKEAALGLLQTLLLSFTVIFSIALVFSFVYFTLKKRYVDELRHCLVPLYHFDPGEYEDWEDKHLEGSKKEIIRTGEKCYRSLSSSV